MRIAILTQPLRYNYGGILQNFALQTCLKRMGHEVVTLDPQRYKYGFFSHISIIIKHIVGKYIRGHKHTKVLKEWNEDSITYKLGKNIFPFVDKYIKRLEYANLYEDVKPNDFDAIIVGSDQVWRPEYNLNLLNMFLDFTIGWNVRRIAFAASFGIDTWNVSDEMMRKCKFLLKQFDYISVREKSAINMCSQLFDITAQLVLDPTLLLTKEDYISILQINNQKKSPGNLLVYILDYNDDTHRLVENVAKQQGLKPFRVNSDYEDRQADISCRVQPPIEQWVRGFLDAECVITDSFHACVFAIIFNKPMVVCINSDRGSSRFSSLFTQMSLSLPNDNNDSPFIYIPEIGRCSKKLSALRAKSLRMLQEFLSEDNCILS